MTQAQIKEKAKKEHNSFVERDIANGNTALERIASIKEMSAKTGADDMLLKMLPADSLDHSVTLSRFLEKHGDGINRDITYNSQLCITRKFW